MVIDDFQHLTAPALARAFDLLLRRSPPNVRWLIAGRCLPDISLGSHRLDQLTMLGAEDLRFDASRIVELSRKLCRRAVSAEDADGARAAGVDGFLAGTLLTLHAYVLLRRNRFDAARRVALRARHVLMNVSAYGLGYADVVASLAERAQGDIKMAITRCEGMFAAVRSGPRTPHG